MKKLTLEVAFNDKETVIDCLRSVIDSIQLGYQVNGGDLNEQDEMYFYQILDVARDVPPVVKDEKLEFLLSGPEKDLLIILGSVYAKLDAWVDTEDGGRLVHYLDAVKMAITSMDDLHVLILPKFGDENNDIQVYEIPRGGIS